MANENNSSTALGQWNSACVGWVTKDYENCGLQLDDYNKACAMNAMTAIYQMVVSDGKTSLNDIDRSSIVESVGQAASLRLNANAMPRECYFQMRNKKVGDKYIKVVEMGIEGDGNDAILRNFGDGIETVYPCWIIKEGDDFTYPKYRGIEVEPPEWTPKGQSNRVKLICYPIKFKDGTVRYLTAEREDCKINLLAHIRQNLMNETFGICENRYKATMKQKEEIAKRKAVILDAIKECETVDDCLKCPEAQPYISMAWLDSTESMVARKLRNNVAKKVTKNFDSVARRSFSQMDEVSVTSEEEIVENENSVDFEEAIEVVTDADDIV